MKLTYGTATDAELLERLLASIAMVHHRLAQSGWRWRGKTDLAAGQRSILLSIDEAGPQTVSALAAARSVSRQFIHALTRRMLTEGWLEAKPNPAHRSSVLLCLTPKANQAVEAIRIIEAPRLERLAARIRPEALAAAVETLTELNAALSERPLKAPGRHRR